MLEVPTDTPVTRPVLLTVATEIFDDVHGVVASAVPVPVSCVVAPIQALKVPLIVGSASMVTVSVTEHPLASR